MHHALHVLDVPDIGLNLPVAKQYNV